VRDIRDVFFIHDWTNDNLNHAEPTFSTIAGNVKCGDDFCCLLLCWSGIGVSFDNACGDKPEARVCGKRGAYAVVFGSCGIQPQTWLGFVYERPLCVGTRIWVGNSRGQRFLKRSFQIWYFSTTTRPQAASDSSLTVEYVCISSNLRQRAWRGAYGRLVSELQEQRSARFTTREYEKQL
jgi:hypothetical protein